MTEAHCALTVLAKDVEEDEKYRKAHIHAMRELESKAEEIKRLKKREQSLLFIIRNERDRWYEIRRWANEMNKNYDNVDIDSILEALDECSKNYAERSKSSVLPDVRGLSDQTG